MISLTFFVKKFGISDCEPEDPHFVDTAQAWYRFVTMLNLMPAPKVWVLIFSDVAISNFILEYQKVRERHQLTKIKCETSTWFVSISQPHRPEKPFAKAGILPTAFGKTSAV